LLVLAAAAWTPGAWWLLYGEAPRGSQRLTAVTPVAAAEYLRDQYTRHPELPRVVFASETLADYLLWDLRLDPPVRICCYTHVHLFSPEQWQKCLAVKMAKRHWQHILDEWGVEFVVLEYDSYEQQEHRSRGKHPGEFALIDRIQASERWVVVSKAEAPVFVAKRRGSAGEGRRAAGLISADRTAGINPAARQVLVGWVESSRPIAATPSNWWLSKTRPTLRLMGLEDSIHPTTPVCSCQLSQGKLPEESGRTWHAQKSEEMAFVMLSDVNG